LKATFSASLLQFSVTQFPLEIILICRIAAEENMYLSMLKAG